MRKDPLLIQAIQLLSMRVGALGKFGESFSLSSCLNYEEREIIGYMLAYIAMNGEEDSLSKQFRNEYIPAMIEIGLAKWRRTELTHLGGKLARSETEDVDISKADTPPEVEYIEPTEPPT